MSIKVIGTGFGRTGTDSMREALTILGFGPCHHMFEVNAHDEQRRLWRALAQGAAPDWNQLFAGYASCVDWPSAHYWRDLIAFYPQARVILTYRSPDSWWESFEKTVLAYINKNTDQESLVATLVARQVFGGRPNDRTHAISAYEANVKAVTETVPKERLLVHELGDGWEPLCGHLGVPTPNQPYPSRNSKDEIRTAFSMN
jgi:Sulfotransferase domain